MNNIITNTKYKILTPTGYCNFSGIRKIKSSTYIKIKTNKSTLNVTPKHIFVVNTQYIFAYKLKVGDKLENNSKEFEIITSIKTINLQKKYKIFYDLTNIEGELYYTNGILSHNCFTGSSYTLVKSDIITKLKNFVISKKWKAPEEVKFSAGIYTFKQWFKPEKGHTYILGGDVSDGIGECFSTALIFDVSNTKTIRLVASFASNTISTMEFPYVIASLATMYNQAFIAIEANNMGRSILDTLNMSYNYDNIINYGGKREMGILSHLQVKGDACRWLRELTSTPEVTFELYDKELVTQIEYFERKTSKKHEIYQAAGDKFDDYVLAWVWAMFVLKEEIADNYFDIEGYITNVYGMKIPLRLKSYNDTYYDVDRSERVFDPKKIDNIYKNLIEKGADIQVPSDDGLYDNDREDSLDDAGIESDDVEEIDEVEPGDWGSNKDSWL